MRTGIHPAIMGLIQELPPTGTYWPKHRREAWLAAIKAVFDVVYPREHMAPARVYGVAVVTLDEPLRLDEYRGAA